MPNPLPTEEISETKSTIKTLQSFVTFSKNVAKKTGSFLQDKRNDSNLMLVLAIISIIVSVYFVYQAVSSIALLNKKTPLLLQLDSYDTRMITDNVLTENKAKNMDSLQDLIDENTSTEKDLAIYSKYLAELQIPYTYFLQQIYLPSLNIWKDPYTNQISIDIIGMKYLQKNPYDDIKLLQKRSDFFKNVGDNNESNDIKNIDIGDIQEDANGYFTIPITVNFTANSKRAFLLLVDKISVTSNKTNISLINEFWYYLWQEIKKDKQTEIKDLTKEYSSLTGLDADTNPDKVIAYNLYNWIFNDKENKLIDRSVIDKTIKNIISCENKSDEVCYYQFRDKYKSIPSFGYFLGTDFTSDPAQNLKKFMLNLPPVFSLKSFSFRPGNAGDVYGGDPNTKYDGAITINVYGRGISSSEIDEIAAMLGKNCFDDGKPMSVSTASDKVSASIAKLSSLERIDKTQSDNLWEIKNSIDTIKSTYDGLSPYKKTIKLFEVYRTLQDGGLCK